VNRPFATERDRRRAAARAALMACHGLAHTPDAVAGLLRPFAGRFLIDPADAGRADPIAGLGVEPVLAPVIGIDAAERAALVSVLRALAERAPR
jgi:hypothetical protein